MDNSSMTSVVESLTSLYQNGKFSEAIDLILKRKSDFGQGSFHYNLGTIYLKKGDFAVARYHLEKAKTKDFAPSIIKNNLILSKQKLGLVNESKTYESVDKVGFYLKDMGMEWYYLMSLTFLLIFFVVLKLQTKKKLVISITTMVFCLASLFTGFYINCSLSNGIILENTALKSGPSAVFPAYMNCKKGERIIIGRTYDGWLKVIFPRAKSGWLNKNDIGLY